MRRALALLTILLLCLSGAVEADDNAKERRGTQMRGHDPVRPPGPQPRPGPAPRVSNKGGRSRATAPPPYTQRPRQPDPASDAYDWLEGLAAAPGLLIDMVCSMSKIRMTQDLKLERDRYPSGRMMFLEFEVTVDDQGGGMGPKSGCVMAWKILDSGMGWPNPQSTVAALDEVGKRRIVWNTIGTGDDLENLQAAVKFNIGSPSPVMIGGPCATASVNATASIHFDGRLIPVDAASVGIEWSTSDPAGLQLVTGPGLRATGSKTETQVLKAIQPGTYTVGATLKRVDPEFIRSLASDAETADRLARELSLVDTRWIQVHVGNAMTEPVTVKPEFLTIGADQTHQFSASGLDWDVCHPTDLTNDDRLSWSTDGGGSVAAGLYTPPLFKPSKVEIEWPYRPDQVDYCTSANFKAKVSFEDPGPQRVIAAYDSEVGEAVVELTPPPEAYIRARLSWDPGQHIGTFGWGDQHDPQPMVVTATYTDGPHTLSGQIEIAVEPPRPLLVFRRLPKKVRVGAAHGARAKLGFEQIRNCSYSLEDVTDESKFTVTAPDGSISTDSWIAFDQDGKYHVRAEYAFPNTGEVLSVDQDVEATSLRATVRVGPIQPGPATGQEP